jgi:hypothetical protein
MPLPDDLKEPVEGAARAAGRAARRAVRAHRHDEAPWFFGIVLVVLGVVFLLDNLGLVESRVLFRNLWPLLVVLFGLSKLVFGRGHERILGVGATVFGSLWLADRLFDWDINVVGTLWPLILIGLGIGLLFKRGPATWPPPFTPGAGIPASPLPGVPPVPGASFSDAGQDTSSRDTDVSASIREVAILAGIQRRNVSQSFRGGSVTAVMGGVELDLRDCRIAGDAAHLTVQVALGQVELRLPRDWVLDSRVGAVLSNIEDRSDPPISGTPKRLVIEGSVFLGQIEIRN